MNPLMTADEVLKIYEEDCKQISKEATQEIEKFKEEGCPEAYKYGFEAGVTFVTEGILAREEF